jgi:hypothetical protein
MKRCILVFYIYVSKFGVRAYLLQNITFGVFCNHTYLLAVIQYILGVLYICVQICYCSQVVVLYPIYLKVAVQNKNCYIISKPKIAICSLVLSHVAICCQTK